MFGQGQRVRSRSTSQFFLTTISDLLLGLSNLVLFAMSYVGSRAIAPKHRIAVPRYERFKVWPRRVVVSCRSRIAGRRRALCGEGVAVSGGAGQGWPGRGARSGRKQIRPSARPGPPPWPS